MEISDVTMAISDATLSVV